MTPTLEVTVPPLHQRRKEARTPKNIFQKRDADSSGNVLSCKGRKSERSLMSAHFSPTDSKTGHTQTHTHTHTQRACQQANKPGSLRPVLTHAAALL